MDGRYGPDRRTCVMGNGMNRSTGHWGDENISIKGVVHGRCSATPPGYVHSKKEANRDRHSPRSKPVEQKAGYYNFIA